MAEVTIKAYTRRSKGGKTVQVHGYTRRVGRKGIRSPKKERSERSGEELEKKLIVKKDAPKLTAEEIARRREFNINFQRAEMERNSLGMTREQYSRHLLKKQSEDKKKPLREFSGSAPLKRPLGTLEKIEDKVARFVEKYSKKKYKRQL